MTTFISEVKRFKLEHKLLRKKWLDLIAKQEKRKIEELCYIFVSDEALLEINQTYLDHDTLTDIITFDNSDEDSSSIEGDIFISIERVEENAKAYKVSLDNELSRVLAHGLLHLCGYKDKTDEEQQLMRSKEEEAISLWLALSKREIKVKL